MYIIQRRNTYILVLGLLTLYTEGRSRLTLKSRIHKIYVDYIYTSQVITFIKCSKDTLYTHPGYISSYWFFYDVLHAYTMLLFCKGVDALSESQ